MPSRINSKPFHAFLYQLQDAHPAGPFSYYIDCDDTYKSFTDSVNRNLVLLATDEIIEYLNSIKKAIDEVRNKEISNGNIELYLDQYDISYDELFSNGDNELISILDNNPLTTESQFIDYKSIQTEFYRFWYSLFLNKAKLNIDELILKYSGTFSKSKRDELNSTEKLLLIWLLQEANLFPKSNQNVAVGSVNNLISAITGVSSGHEVGKIFNGKIAGIYKKNLSTKQQAERLNNIAKIKPLIDKLNIREVNDQFTLLERATSSKM